AVNISRMPADDRIARSVALEQAYVHDVYEQFSENPRSRPWPRVQQFLEDLEQGSIICDVGCGNGKYLNVNTSIFNIGGDKSTRLCELAREKNNEVIVVDNLTLPFRDESLDAVLSIAVVHHLATTERRIRALRELARVLRIGGRIIISVWAMEQSHRKFESQDVLVPWHRPQQLSTPSLELTSTTTTSEDDCLPPYHAYTQSDSDSNKSNKTKSGMKKRGKTRHKGRSIDPGRSSSPSSSSLSSPNETCYSFVRRAIQKLAGGRRGVHRPWFLDSWTHCSRDSHSKRFEQDGCTCCECEDVQNLPIELRRVDDDELPQRRQTFPSSQLFSEIYSNLKSRSLIDIKTVENNNIVRSKSSVPSIQEALNNEEHSDSKSKSSSASTKPKLVKQKQSICDEDEEEALDKPTDMKNTSNVLPDSKIFLTSCHRGSVFKQRSLNEDIMSVERLREKERVKQNIQKQASLNEELIYRRHRTLDSLKDSIFSVSTSKRFQLIKTGFTNKIKNSTTNIEKVTSSSLRNGFVRMLQNWKSSDLTSPVIPEDEAIVTSPSNINVTINDEKKESGANTEERRHSKEDGSDSSKDSSLQSDTSVDSEDSFASVIFVPKTDPTSPSQLSPGPTSPRISNASVPNSPRIKQSSCPTSPRIKQMPLSVYPLTKQLSSPKPSTCSTKFLLESPLSPGSIEKTERDQKCTKSTIAEQSSNSNSNKILIQTLAQKYAVPHIPKFRKTSLNSNTTVEKTVSESDSADKNRNKRLKYIKDLLSQKPGFGVRAVRSNYPIVRRSSMSNGNYDTMARPLPKLLSLELFNPETDDKDSDSSAVSSPDSIESVVENKNKSAPSKFTFPPTSNKYKAMDKHSKSLLQAAADVAHSLDEAVEKVIKSSPRTKKRQLNRSDLISVVQKQFETDSVPLLSSEAEFFDTSWDEECHKHLTEFADKLSEKLLNEIDHYRKKSSEGEILDGISDPYINRLSEELNDLSKLSEEIQKQNEYLAKLSASDNFYNKLQCDKRTDQELKTSVEMKQEKSEIKKDAKKEVCKNDCSEVPAEDLIKIASRLETKCTENTDLTAGVSIKHVNKGVLKKGSSIESCESEKGSSSNSIISSVATSVHFGLSMESTDGISEKGSSDSHKDTNSISRYSDGGSTASLVSCPEWTMLKNRLPEEQCLIPDNISQRKETNLSKNKEKSGMNPSLSDTSQESLPSDNMGGAITYHRYYHVFREGELDQLIEKYVQNLHIISSYYDHSSWCVVAEKVQCYCNLYFVVQHLSTRTKTNVEMSSYFDQWNSSIVRPSHVTDQRFGVVLDSGDVVSPLIVPLNTVYIGKGLVPNYSRPWRSQLGRSDKGSTVITNKNKYEINLDVQQFEPNEITVKVNGNNVVVQAHHEEKQDQHGSISREFLRKYWVPNGYNLNKVSSNLSSDGVLTITVTRCDDVNEDRVIPILQTGVAVERNESDNENVKKCDDDKRKEKRNKKVEEKHGEKREDKQEEQCGEKQEDKPEEQKEEDQKND
ncbi:hypothetical protein RN001_002742, partial [Aquatica leii]